ncbi:tpi-1, partial [Symbiodinium sp. CCMP2456]
HGCEGGEVPGSRDQGDLLHRRAPRGAGGRQDGRGEQASARRGDPEDHELGQHCDRLRAGLGHRNRQGCHTRAGGGDPGQHPRLPE